MKNFLIILFSILSFSMVEAQTWYRVGEVNAAKEDGKLQIYNNSGDTLSLAISVLHTSENASTNRTFWLSGIGEYDGNIFQQIRFVEKDFANTAYIDVSSDADVSGFSVSVDPGVSGNTITPKSLVAATIPSGYNILQAINLTSLEFLSATFPIFTNGSGGTDGDGNPLNEIQALSVTFVNDSTDVCISGANCVRVPKGNSVSFSGTTITIDGVPHDLSTIDTDIEAVEFQNGEISVTEDGVSKTTRILSDLPANDLELDVDGHIIYVNPDDDVINETTGIARRNIDMQGFDIKRTGEINFDNKDGGSELGLFGFREFTDGANAGDLEIITPDLVQKYKINKEVPSEETDLIRMKELTDAVSSIYSSTNTQLDNYVEKNSDANLNSLTVTSAPVDDNDVVRKFELDNLDIAGFDGVLPAFTQSQNLPTNAPAPDYFIVSRTNSNGEDQMASKAKETIPLSWFNNNLDWQTQSEVQSIADAAKVVAQNYADTNDDDTQLTEAQVDAFADNNGYVEENTNVILSRIQVTNEPLADNEVVRKIDLENSLQNINNNIDSTLLFKDGKLGVAPLVYVDPKSALISFMSINDAAISGFKIEENAATIKDTNNIVFVNDTIYFLPVQDNARASAVEKITEGTIEFKLDNSAVLDSNDFYAFLQFFDSYELLQENFMLHYYDSTIEFSSGGELICSTAGSSSNVFRFEISKDNILFFVDNVEVCSSEIAVPDSLTSVQNAITKLLEKEHLNDVGATGAQGLKGDTGDTGPAGADGTDGVDGKNVSFFGGLGIIIDTIINGNDSSFTALLDTAWLSNFISSNPPPVITNTYSELSSLNTSISNENTKIGDMDGDGDLDVFSVSDAGNIAAWYSNDGSGNLTESTITIPSFNNFANFDLGDMDGDGDMDVIVNNNGFGEVIMLQNDGNENFTSIVIDNAAFSTGDVKTIDFDNDGDLDIVVAMFGNVRIYTNNSGTFTQSNHTIVGGTGNPSALNAADMDADGDIDIMIGESGGTGIVYLENNSGSFTETSFSSGPYIYRNIDIVDLDGDGDLDFLTAKNSSILFFENTSGNFTLTSIPSSGSIAYVSTGDYNGDGDIDISAALLNDNTLDILRNDGSQNFSSFQITGINTVFSLASGDMTGDGKVNIVAGALSSVIKIIKND